MDALTLFNLIAFGGLITNWATFPFAVTYQKALAKKQDSQLLQFITGFVTWVHVTAMVVAVYGGAFLTALLLTFSIGGKGDNAYLFGAILWALFPIAGSLMAVYLLKRSVGGSQ